MGRRSRKPIDIGRRPIDTVNLYSRKMFTLDRLVVVWMANFSDEFLETEF
jgi:hypothetical protein